MLCSKCGYHYILENGHTCPPVGISGVNGYTCQFCFTWVPNGNPHACLNTNWKWAAGPTFKQTERIINQLTRIADSLEGLQKDEMGALKVRVK